MEPLPGTATPTRTLIELGVSPAELRRPEWRHPHRGVARPGGVDESHPLTRITDALPLLPGCGVLGGWSSLFLHGVEHVDGTTLSGDLLPVRLHTCARHRRIPRAGVQPTRRRLHGNELTRLDGRPVTTVARAVYDEMCLARTTRDAVVWLDLVVSRLTAGPRVDLAHVRALVGRHVKTRGITRARLALELASEWSASPLETRTRLVVADAFPGLVTRVNRPVFTRAGELLGIPDLADPDAGVVLESDGAVHRSLVRQTSDNQRDDRFAAANLTCMRVTSEDHRSPERLRARVRSAYARAAARDWVFDDWTFATPAWWPESELARRWG